MSVSSAQARRATGLLLAGLLLTFTQSSRTRSPEIQLNTQQLLALQEDRDQRDVREVAAKATQTPVRNISGTYRGTWCKLQYEADISTAFLKHEHGMLVFRLDTYPSLRQGVTNVQGELIARDGTYSSAGDILFRVQGAYIVELRKMIAVLEPVAPVVVPLTTQDAVYLPDYRQSLRQSAASYLSLLEGRKSIKSLPAMRACQFAADITFGISKEVFASNAINVTGDNSARRTDKVESQLGFDGFEVNGTLFSSNCGIVLQLNASATDIEAYYAKAINYTIMVTVVAFVQIMLLVKQMEVSNTQALASRVSLLTIAQQAVLDAYLCLLHLTVGIMVEPLFNAFATAAFFEFVIFAIFEMRFLLLVWRARRNGTMDLWTAQRELSILYGRFYGALLGGILLSFYLHRFIKFVVFVLYSFWIPQIVLCLRTDCPQPLQPLYVIGMSLARLVLPLYLFWCPKNLLRAAPSPVFCTGLVLFVAVQASILLVQYWKGARYFIPKRFLPPKYDYHQVSNRSSNISSCNHPDIETGEALDECVICMNPVNTMELSQRMVTPCNHFFHPQCLSRWMNVKMECPTCRRALPPL